MNKEQIIQEIEKIHSELKKQTDFSPRNSVINRNLTRLVTLCSLHLDIYDTHQIITNKIIKKISKSMVEICSNSEAEMEKFFSIAFLKNKELSIHTLKDFIYYQNYYNLCNDEIKLANIDKKDKILFIGSGPLPLTAILIAHLTGANCISYDIDKKACDLSSELIKRIGLEKKVEVINRDGLDADFNNYDIIIIASLVEPKKKILERIKKKGYRKRIILRSSEGIRRLLYNMIRNEELTGFSIKNRTIPTTCTINTSLLLEAF